MNWNYILYTAVLCTRMASSIHAMEEKTLDSSITLAKILATLETLEAKTKDLENQSSKREEELTQLNKTIDSLVELLQQVSENDPEKEKARKKILEKKQSITERLAKNRTAPEQAIFDPAELDRRDRRARREAATTASMVTAVILVPVLGFVFYLCNRTVPNQPVIVVLQVSGRVGGSMLRMATKEALRLTLQK